MLSAAKGRTNGTNLLQVSCGQTFTLAISDDGSQVFAFGKADNAAFGTRGVTGDHFYPMLLNHLTPFGPFVKSSSGNRVSALINTRGQLCWFGEYTLINCPEYLPLLFFSSLHPPPLPPTHACLHVHTLIFPPFLPPSLPHLTSPFIFPPSMPSPSHAHIHTLIPSIAHTSLVSPPLMFPSLPPSLPPSLSLPHLTSSLPLSSIHSLSLSY